MKAIRGSRFGQWLLNRSIAKHLVDPRRFDRGPARCNIEGWLYFDVFGGAD